MGGGVLLCALVFLAERSKRKDRAKKKGTRKQESIVISTGAPTMVDGECAQSSMPRPSTAGNDVNQDLERSKYRMSTNDISQPSHAKGVSLLTGGGKHGQKGSVVIGIELTSKAKVHHSSNPSLRPEASLAPVSKIQAMIREPMEDEGDEESDDSLDGSRKNSKPMLPERSTYQPPEAVASRAVSRAPSQSIPVPLGGIYDNDDAEDSDDSLDGSRKTKRPPHVPNRLSAFV